MGEKKFDKFSRQLGNSSKMSTQIEEKSQQKRINWSLPLAMLATGVVVGAFDTQTGGTLGRTAALAGLGAGGATLAYQSRDIVIGKFRKAFGRNPTKAEEDAAKKIAKMIKT